MVCRHDQRMGTSSRGNNQGWDSIVVSQRLDRIGVQSSMFRNSQGFDSNGCVRFRRCIRFRVPRKRCSIDPQGVVKGSVFFGIEGFKTRVCNIFTICFEWIDLRIVLYHNLQSNNCRLIVSSNTSDNPDQTLWWHAVVFGKQSQSIPETFQ